jgi:N-acetyl-gamma-glutamylphosphate reductase
LRGASRVANPGCFPAASLLALAPLLHAGLVEPHSLVIDAKSGVTGTGRGAAADFGFVASNEASCSRRIWCRSREAFSPPATRSVGDRGTAAHIEQG